MGVAAGLHGGSRHTIEIALVAGFGLIAAILAVVHFSAGNGAGTGTRGRAPQPLSQQQPQDRGREGEYGPGYNADYERQRAQELERARQQAAWTSQLSRVLVTAARRLAADGPAEQVRAVEAALTGGDLAAIEAAFTALAASVSAAASAKQAVPAAEPLSSPQVQAQASMTIARRVLASVIKVLRQLDALQRETEDPEALKTLFAIDEQVTRIRRAIETLAVLGGVAPRSASRPVALHTLLRQAVAETEDYKRVQILPPVSGLIHSVAATDVIHLVAELVENAAKFSRPDTTVSVRVQEVSAGLAIDVDDRGLGMDPRECERACTLLATLDPAQVAQRLSDGQLGFVASAHFAARHGISVRVEGNVVGGVHSLVLLPHALLTDAAPAAGIITGSAVEVAAEAPREQRTRPALTPVNPQAVGVPRLPAQVSQPADYAADYAGQAGAHAYQASGMNGVASTAPPPPAPAPPAPPVRRPLPRREGSYLPQPAAPDPEPAAGAGTFSPGLLAGFQSGYQTGVDSWDSGDDANGYELPHRKA
jgi:signal transduction histidine kinase